MSRSRRPAVLVVLVSAVPLLAGCVSTEGGTTPRDVRQPIPTGSIVPIAAPATSYEALGPLGKYARALDEDYGVKPDFAEWDLQGDLNCSWVAGGDLQVMGEPFPFSGLPDETRPGEDGSIIHPIAGKAWAASVVARCPELLTAYVRSHLEVEESAGLVWAKSVD